MKQAVEFYGTKELLQKIEAIGKNVETAVMQALSESIEEPKKDMLNYVKQHKRTGKTEQSFVDKLELKKGVVTSTFGFDISNGGLPVVFLNYGTPTIEPSFFIDDAIKNNANKIKKAQIDALNRIIQGG